jgi:hypothetical protein
MSSAAEARTVQRGHAQHQNRSISQAHMNDCLALMPANAMLPSAMLERPSVAAPKSEFTRS